jgi:hypothetical protein
VVASRTRLFTSFGEIAVHNYQKKLMQLQSEGKLPQGGFTNVTIKHDDWCRTYNAGECNCDPEIEFTEVTDENKETVARRISKDTAEFRAKMKKKMV